MKNIILLMVFLSGLALLAQAKPAHIFGNNHPKWQRSGSPGWQKWF
jgi:hypothetical protein